MPPSSNSVAPLACPSTCAVRRCVAMAHVVDVEKSVDFYARLGFTCRSTVKDHFGRTNWASLVSDGAEIMFARASGEIDHDQQAVLFYMYSADVVSLRDHLLATGLRDAGHFPHTPAEPNPSNSRAAVFAIANPFYMPAGELRVHDPDGYVILVGQLT